MLLQLGPRKQSNGPFGYKWPIQACPRINGPRLLAKFSASRRWCGYEGLVGPPLHMPGSPPPTCSICGLVRGIVAACCPRMLRAGWAYIPLPSGPASSWRCCPPSGVVLACRITGRRPHYAHHPMCVPSCQYNTACGSFLCIPGCLCTTVSPIPVPSVVCCLLEGLSPTLAGAAAAPYSRTS